MIELCKHILFLNAQNLNVKRKKIMEKTHQKC